MTIQGAAPEADAASTGGTWLPWRVSPGSGFEVYVAAGDRPTRPGTGEVRLLQVDPSTFLVVDQFRFTDAAVQAGLEASLVDRGMGRDEALRRIDDARTFTPSTENPTDLASIPRFLRWFENPYGVHTLAATIHDELIVPVPNGGALGSDTLADRFFRQMLATAGVPWLKRWLMWAAVALRSRWAAGGYRRASVVAWLALATAGIAAFAWGAGASSGIWDPPVPTAVLLTGAVVLPVLAAPLWGKQAGAALVAAVGAAWILPPAIFGGIGYLVYRVLERVAGSLGLR
jgi:hypothetical protein